MIGVDEIRPRNPPPLVDWKDSIKQTNTFCIGISETKHFTTTPPPPSQVTHNHQQFKYLDWDMIVTLG